MLLRKKKAPPKKGASIKSDDPKDNDDLNMGRNKVKSDGKGTEKDKKKNESTNLREQVGELMNLKETVMTKHMETKMVMVEKKHQL
jgi:hypothetical protein